MSDQRDLDPNLLKMYSFLVFSKLEGAVTSGMIHLGDLNKSLRTAESGMFIAEKDYRGTGLAFSASLLLLEFAFKELGLKELFAKVKNDNIQAQDYNKLLGFQEKRKLTNDFSQWSLEKDNYELKMPFLKRRMD